MAKIVSPVIARIEVIGKPKESQHQAGSYYYPTLFLDESLQGDEAKIWKNLSGDEVSQLKKGDRVQLIPAGTDQKGNPNHNIVLLDTAAPTTAPPVQPANPGLTAGQKRAIAQFGTDIIAAYKFLYERAKAELEPIGASEETVRVCASSALIACQKKLGFDR